jgi:tetratricopeptide (TPR) repeat protein
MTTAQRRVLLVGWDAADWKVAQPLMDRGHMPHLARLVAGGVAGNLATIYPAFSPMVWTSIATGKRPTKHGIHGFSEPLPDGSGVRPVTTLGRKTKAIWNILHQNSLRPSIVGWWPSHPAEPIRGVMISNHYPRAGDGPEAAPLLPGTIHPRDWADRLAEVRVTPMELPGEAIGLFVPEYQRIDQAKDKRLHTLGKILAETMTLHAAATEVIEHAEWDFAAVYYDAIDHFSHAFMQYHPPRLPWVEEADFALYQHILAAAYRYHDLMLGRLLQLAGKGVTVIVMSDHGFHPDHLRPGYVPAEAAGPAVEHRHFGMICLNGPGIVAGERLYGAGVLDVTPTLLHLFGLPVGRDMDGKVLVTAFEKPGKVEAIPSWDEVPGEAGTHPPEARLDPVAAAEALKQLVALGYVAPAGDDVRANVEETVAELKFNLARAHDDAGRPDLAVPLYEELWRRKIDDQRVVERLVHSLLILDRHDRAREVLDAFDARCAVRAPEAAAELERREKEKPARALDPQRKNDDQREHFERRVLAEQSTGFLTLRAVLRLRLNIAEVNWDELRKRLAQVEGGLYRVPPRFMIEAYARLDEDAKAQEWVAEALKRDPEDWQVLGQAARLHLRRKRYSEAIDAAAESLSLIYFQPVLHYVLGCAQMAMDDIEAAERSLRMAIGQLPGLIPAHKALAKLYETLIPRPAEATLHRRKAVELLERAESQRLPAVEAPSAAEPIPPLTAFAERAIAPSAFDKEIIIVTGLPRSGTSMLMQVLVAGGVPVLTDGLRQPDEDNPHGYFEHEAATRLRHDSSWLPQARGRAVKLVLPLLPFLPAGETYRVIVIERDLGEVLASQRKMLSRLGRDGSAAELSENELVRAYLLQRERVRAWLDRQPEIALLPLSYAEVLQDPHRTVHRLGAFLGRALDAAAAGAVDPSLRRQFSAI